MRKHFIIDGEKVTVFDGDHLSIDEVIDEIENYEYKKRLREEQEEKLRRAMLAAAKVAASLRKK